MDLEKEISAIVVFENFNMLLYGGMGVGKTVLFASATEVPELCPVLLIDIEGGMLSIAGKKIDTIKVIERAGKQNIRPWVYLKALRDQIRNDIRAGKFPYKTIILDSGSEIARFCLEDTTGTEVPQIKDYYLLQSRLHLFFQSFQYMPVNTLVTAKERPEGEDEIGNRRPFRPDFTPSVELDVGHLFDIVCRMTVKALPGGDERRLTTSVTAHAKAKDRSWALPKELKLPDFEKDKTPGMKAVTDLIFDKIGRMKSEGVPVGKSEISVDEVVTPEVPATETEVAAEVKGTPE